MLYGKDLTVFLNLLSLKMFKQFRIKRLSVLRTGIQFVCFYGIFLSS